LIQLPLLPNSLSFDWGGRSAPDILNIRNIFRDKNRDHKLTTLDWYSEILKQVPFFSDDLRSIISDVIIQIDVVIDVSNLSVTASSVIRRKSIDVDF
jgi:hypothetical protein